MSAVAKALVTSSNWKVGRWEVRTFLGFNRLGLPRNHHFFAGGFSIHQPFWGSPMETPKDVGKVCRKRLSGNNVHSCEPFRYSSWHFFSQCIFCTKVFSERYTPADTKKHASTSAPAKEKWSLIKAWTDTKPVQHAMVLSRCHCGTGSRRRRCRQVLHHSERWSPLVAQELSVCCMNSQRSGRSSCCISGCQNMCMLYACKQKLH